MLSGCREGAYTLCDCAKRGGCATRAGVCAVEPARAATGAVHMDRVCGLGPLPGPGAEEQPASAAAARPVHLRRGATAALQPAELLRRSNGSRQPGRACQKRVGLFLYLIEQLLHGCPQAAAWFFPGCCMVFPRLLHGSPGWHKVTAIVADTNNTPGWYHPGC